jgi:hypothetical protein
MVVLTGQAGRRSAALHRARSVKEDLERIAGVDQVLALGFQDDPELLVEFRSDRPGRARPDRLRISPMGCGCWFRDVFAGKVKTGERRMAGAGQWHHRRARAMLAGSSCNRQRARPGRQSAARRRGQDTSAGATMRASSPAWRRQDRRVMLFGEQDRLHQHARSWWVTRSMTTSTRKNAVLAGERAETGAGRRPDRWRRARSAWASCRTNAMVGLAAGAGRVLAVPRLAHRAPFVSLGVWCSRWPAPSCVLETTVGSTLNVSVLLGIVIVLGMLVDDAVVAGRGHVFPHAARRRWPRPRRWIRMREVGCAGHRRRSSTTTGGVPAADAAAGHRRQVHVRHPLRRHHGADWSA